MSKEKRNYSGCEADGKFTLRIESNEAMCGLMITLRGRGAFYYRAKHDRKDVWTK